MYQMFIYWGKSTFSTSPAAIVAKKLSHM